MYRPFEDLMDMTPTLTLIQELVPHSKLTLICDTKGANGLMMIEITPQVYAYRLDHSRIISFLKSRVSLLLESYDSMEFFEKGMEWY